MEVIVGKQGNQKLSIVEPTVSRRHCRIVDNGDGTYVVENLSTSSFTKVDGRDIIKANATKDSEIQLGPVFKVKLKDLIAGNEKPKEKEYNISHLQTVWENFNEKNLDLAKKQQKLNLTRTGLGIFTMCAMPTIFFLGPIGYALTGIGVVGNIYSFVGMKNIESPEERQKRMDKFDESWVCPNPECGRTLPAKNFSMLKRNFQSCPYCKCKYKV